MADAVQDDLAKPLKGRGRRQTRGKAGAKGGSRLSLARLILAGLLLGAAGLGLYIALIDDPLGGEPHQLARIVPKSNAVPEGEAPPRREARQPPPPDTRPSGPASAGDIERQSGVAVVRGPGEGVPGSVVIRLPDPVSTRLAPAPDARLVERTRYGLLPRVGADGSRAAEIYARPVPPASDAPGPRIAIVVGGLGISQTATAEAVSRLPGPVSLAFAPYGADLESHVQKARDDGHEVLLQVPMEPFDYPDNDPGPHTLTVEARLNETIDKLHWLMGRFPGYVGLVNFMGAKLTAQGDALAPIVKEIGDRGLFFLDDGSSPRSQSLDVAKRVKTPVMKADLVLDVVARADAIDKELARLETLARQKGAAVATASGLPLTVDRITRWAEAAEKRGLRLVPVSALAGGVAP